MKEYRYRGFKEPIQVNNDIITYRGKEIEKFYYGYDAKGCPQWSYKDLMKSHYINEMKRIDREIEAEEYKEAHKEEFENLMTADESIEYFFNMVNE